MFPTMAQNKPPPMKLYILSDTKASSTVPEEKTAGVGVSGGSDFVTELKLHSAVILKQHDDDDGDDDNDDAEVWKYYRADRCL